MQKYYAVAKCQVDKALAEETMNLSCEKEKSLFNISGYAKKISDS